MFGLFLFLFLFLHLKKKKKKIRFPVLVPGSAICVNNLRAPLQKKKTRHTPLSPLKLRFRFLSQDVTTNAPPACLTAKRKRSIHAAEQVHLGIGSTCSSSVVCVTSNLHVRGVARSLDRTTSHACVMATMPPSILRLVRRNDERFSPQIQHHTTKIQTLFRFSIFRGELLENAVKYIYFLYMARKKTRLREIICII